MVIGKTFIRKDYQLKLKTETHEILALSIVETRRRHGQTLVDVLLTIDAGKAFRAVAGDRSRFRKVPARSSILAPVVYGAVVDPFFAGRSVESVGTLTAESVGQVDAGAAVGARIAQTFVDVFTAHRSSGSSF